MLIVHRCLLGLDANWAPRVAGTLVMTPAALRTPSESLRGVALAELREAISPASGGDVTAPSVMGVPRGPSGSKPEPLFRARRSGSTGCRHGRRERSVGQARTCCLAADAGEVGNRS